MSKEEQPPELYGIQLIKCLWEFKGQKLKSSSDIYGHSTVTQRTKWTPSGEQGEWFSLTVELSTEINYQGFRL